MRRKFWSNWWSLKPRPRRTLRPRPAQQYLLWKEKARAYIRQRVDYFNQTYQFPFNRLAIRNQRSLWGSCSAKRNLNFNYRLVFLPQPLSDYIIVHELCHLQDLNHSPQFWSLVSQTIPDYRQLKKQLRGIKVR